MAAYVVVDVHITDPQEYEVYKSLTPASLTAFGGRFIVRGAPTETLEGTWQPGRLVILEFENAERAKAWWSSELYAPAKLIRHATAHTEMILVEGV